MTTSASAAPSEVPPLPGQAPGAEFLVRSEEQLQVSTDRVLAGYARLEKYTVTETKTITVEVAHEEVRLVHRGADGSESQHSFPAGADDPDTDRWMVLSREEVVVSKHIVPVERVRLEVYPVAEQRQVTDQVRKEQIDTAPETVWTATKDTGSLS